MAVQASPHQIHYHVMDTLAANALPLPTPAAGVAATADHTPGNVGWLQQQLQHQRDQPQQHPPTLSAVLPATGNSGSGRKRPRDQQYSVCADSSELHAVMRPPVLHHLQRQQAALMQNQLHAAFLPSLTPVPPPVGAAADEARSGAGDAVASTSGRQSGVQSLFMVPPPPLAIHGAAVTTATAASAAVLQEDCFLSMLQRHSLDIDALIRDHDEKLCLALRHICRRQFLASATALERRAQLCLQARQSELRAAILHNAELEDQVRQAEAEAREWATAAKKGDAMVNDLYAKLNQATVMPAPMPPRDAPGASCAEEGSGDNGEQAVAAYIDEESSCGGVPEADAGLAVGKTEMAKATMTGTTAGVACRVCRGGNEATVLLLPCHHLCLCAACETAAGPAGVLACPVCGVLKNASLQIAPVSLID